MGWFRVGFCVDFLVDFGMMISNVLVATITNRYCSNHVFGMMISDELGLVFIELGLFWVSNQ